MDLTRDDIALLSRLADHLHNAAEIVRLLAGHSSHGYEMQDSLSRAMAAHPSQGDGHRPIKVT